MLPSYADFDISWGWPWAGALEIRAFMLVLSCVSFVTGSSSLGILIIQLSSLWEAHISVEVSEQLCFHSVVNPLSLQGLLDTTGVLQPSDQGQL